MPEKEQIEHRKIDHLDLASKSVFGRDRMDQRFFYEPLLSGQTDINLTTTFLGYQMKYPVWVSSMTGGTVEARTINQHLARLCREYGLGMGLGSCRVLLDSTDRLADFAMRPIIGPDQPLFANIGIAQVETLLHDGEISRLQELIELLDANGIIIHVNPLQEWAQEEGDRYHRPAIDMIEEVADALDSLLIVKEVGQGMGPASLRRLMESQVDGIEFAAAGGTNFTRLELLRASDQWNYKDHLSGVGHTVDDMLQWTNAYASKESLTKPLILSGGIRNYLDGYYAIASSDLPAIYGMAGAFLPHARMNYEALQTFFTQQMDGLAMAKAYLTVRVSK